MTAVSATPPRLEKSNMAELVVAANVKTIELNF